MDSYYKNRKEIYDIAIKDELNNSDIKEFNLLKDRYVNIRYKNEEYTFNKKDPQENSVHFPYCIVTN